MAISFFAISRQFHDVFQLRQFALEPDFFGFFPPPRRRRQIIDVTLVFSRFQMATASCRRPPTDE